MHVQLAVKTSHPALLSPGLGSAPMTPVSGFAPCPADPVAPMVSYAQLRAHHATSIRYVIAKLRWEQTNNGYLRGEDAWLNHNRMINKLEAELTDVEAAQKGLDRFPNCFAAIAFPEPHGPPSRDQFEKEERAQAEKDKMIDDKLNEQFPFIQQLFIGPRTKQQARNDKMLRAMLKEGDFDEVTMLLPSENKKMLMAMQDKKGPGGGAVKKVPYEQARRDKEKARLADLKADDGIAPRKPVQPVFGPPTREEWLAALPKFGPLTKHEAMLPAQREQRHVILSWLRKPWRKYDEDAAPIMAALGRLALGKMEGEGKEPSVHPPAVRKAGNTAAKDDTKPNAQAPVIPLGDNCVH